MFDFEMSIWINFVVFVWVLHVKAIALVAVVNVVVVLAMCPGKQYILSFKTFYSTHALANIFLKFFLRF